MTCLRAGYLCEWWTDEVKINWFSTSGSLPILRGWTDAAKVIWLSTSCPPSLRSNRG
ncbi:hypothetical protein [Globicatella sanguinis]